MKTLILYYSHYNHTKDLALLIAKATGGDLCCINPKQAYPSSYQDVVEQAKKEIQEAYFPEVLPLKYDIQQYDTIYIGTPNWWSTLAPPVGSVLKNSSFVGKTIVPFGTHGGGGSAHIEEDMKKLCPHGQFKKGYFAFENQVNIKDIKIWLEK